MMNFCQQLLDPVFLLVAFVGVAYAALIFTGLFYTLRSLGKAESHA